MHSVLFPKFFILYNVQCKYLNLAVILDLLKAQIYKQRIGNSKNGRESNSDPHAESDDFDTTLVVREL
jgi:hypothetical protein